VNVVFICYTHKKPHLQAIVNGILRSGRSLQAASALPGKVILKRHEGRAPEPTHGPRFYKKCANYYFSYCLI
jgi:hypothetical protein